MSVTTVCDCGSDRESTEHFLFQCSKYAEARRVMLDNIKDMADKFNDYFSSVFTEESMLDIPVCVAAFPYPGDELSDVL